MLSRGARYEPILNQLIADKIGEEAARELDFWHPAYVPTILPKGVNEVNLEPLREVRTGQGSNSWVVRYLLVLSVCGLASVLSQHHWSPVASSLSPACRCWRQTRT